MGEGESKGDGGKGETTRGGLALIYLPRKLGEAFIEPFSLVTVPCESGVNHLFHENLCNTNIKRRGMDGCS